MKINILLLLYFFCLSCYNDQKDSTLSISNQQEEENELIPDGAISLLKHYKQIRKYKNNYLYFFDGDSLIFDDRIKKTYVDRLENPSISDQFYDEYVLGENFSKNRRFIDPGRYRNINFFKKIYGKTKDEVENNLTTITWCPKTVNKKIRVTTINNVHLKLIEISKILDTMPKFTKYISNPAGTYNWRNVRNSNRLSMHSFGMTIDINVENSNYWQWDCKCSDETKLINFKNQIPLELVMIFEKFGFIWGGKWYHYDTMHFEYRPELLT